MRLKRTLLFVVAVFASEVAVWTLQIPNVPIHSILFYWGSGQIFSSFGLGEAQAAENTTITAVWANDGGDKVTRDELRANPDPNKVLNSVWNGAKVRLFGAKNEVVAFNLILESASTAASNVTVSFNQLTGPDGASIASLPANGDGVFDWRNRNIELFYIRYLEIKGLSLLSYNVYDERHIPARCRRPYREEYDSGYDRTYTEAYGSWEDRPCHNKFYPDIAVPLELKPSFDIEAGQNQSIWVDIYIPKSVPIGLYQGTILIQENGATTYQIPVELSVRNFTLPDVPNAKTMLYTSYENINKRYLGEPYPDPDSPNFEASKLIRDRHFLVAHRHRLSLIDSANADLAPDLDQPVEEWLARLDGRLFTADHGYDGPGVNEGNNVYSIGTYGIWGWKDEGEEAMRFHTDAWVNWFDTNSPGTEYFLYLIDESNDFPRVEQWAQWINNNPGPGSRLMSMATISMPTAIEKTPSLDIVASWMMQGITEDWQKAADSYRISPDKKGYFYNGGRPATGTFAIEDDGVALWALAWAQYKKEIDRWFFWESSYYNNSQGGTGKTNVFRQAHTFGSFDGFDEVRGETGWNYANGDGVLFYPGTDLVYPESSYGVNGPFASLRLKQWRRGIQDVDYLTLAAKINPERVSEIVAQMVPKVLWEYGVNEPWDPTWVWTDISWSIDPDMWAAARAELAAIIESGGHALSPLSNLRIIQ